MEHGRPAVLYVREEQRALFRARQRLYGARAAPMARAAAQVLCGPLEDLLLSPSALFIGRNPRLRNGPPETARAAVRHVRRERGVLWPRPHLRAHEAPEGCLLFRLGI